MKQAILLVAFGTSVPEAEKAYEMIEDQVRSEFPEIEIRWAYTSKKIRRKLEGLGELLPSPELVMARTMQDGYTHVAVLSLHVIPGIEFHELSTNMSLFGRMVGGVKRVVVSRPLLNSQADCKRLARLLMDHLPDERTSDDTVLFMGHGTAKHPAYALYYALNAAFQELDPHVHVGRVMGVPDLQELMPKITATPRKTVYLIPLMAVAGDHARNDMAGDNPESWKSVLENAGVSCRVVLRGIAEYPDIVRIWIDHLRTAREELMQ